MILQSTHILRTGYHVICLHVTVPFCLVGAPFAFMYLILLQIARYNVPGTLGTLTQSSSRRPFSHDKKIHRAPQQQSNTSRNSESDCATIALDAEKTPADLSCLFPSKALMKSEKTIEIDELNLD